MAIDRAGGRNCQGKRTQSEVGLLIVHDNLCPGHTASEQDTLPGAEG